MATVYIGKRFNSPDVVDGHTAVYFYDTVTAVISFQDIPVTDVTSFPASGTVIYSECDGADLIEYEYNSGDTQSSIDIDVVTTADSPSCCSVNPADFTIEVVADDGSDSGSIKITSGTVDVDLYEASLNSAAYVPGASAEIEFTGLAAAAYSVRIRLIDGACTTEVFVIIPSKSVTNPFSLALVSPDQFMPVFWPIQYDGSFTGNEVDIVQSGPYTVIETSEASIQAYLATLPQIRVYGSANYDSVYTVLQALSATQYVIQATYVSDETVSICPASRQTFYLYCERTFNQFIKIAEIGIAADEDGNFAIRVEGFLQSEFLLNPPVEGDEITLGRKYYLQSPDFGLTTDITTAVYSAIESLTPYLEDLVPLGPAPMNFISEQTQKGLPVLFSYLNTTTGRVVNIISSKETDIVGTNDIELNALPCNQYDIEWIKVAGNLNGSVTSDPVLPSWISLTQSGDRVYLEIDTCGGGSDGDYEPDDYLSQDYLTAGFNSLVGCYEFELSDGDGVLFNLSICIFPIQQPVAEVCPDDAFIIAWVNRHGGWSSYAFASDRGDKSKKTRGVDIGGSTDFQRESELKQSSVQGVYDNAVVFFSNKSQRDLIFIASLRVSIQAYLFNETTSAWDIPIVIDKDSFPTYSVPFNQAQDGNGSFTFRYADEIKIQRQ